MKLAQLCQEEWDTLKDALRILQDACSLECDEDLDWMLGWRQNPKQCINLETI